MNRSKLSQFVEDTCNWTRIVETNDQTILTRFASSGQGSTVEIVEPSAERKQTLRTINILTYSLYEPEEVRDFLANEYTSISNEVGLSYVKDDQFYNNDVKKMIDSSNHINNCTQVIERTPGIEKIAEVLNEVEVDPSSSLSKRGPCGYDDPMRHMVQPHCRLIRESSIPVEPTPITSGSSLRYIVSGGPVMIGDKAGDAMQMGYE